MKFIWLKRQSSKMRVLYSLALTLCFQVALLQAYCHGLHEATGQASPADHRLGNGNNDKPQHRPRPDIRSNRTQDNEIDIFRLEFNKYKILSHLSITSNLDDIKPRIDEELRYKLITSSTLKDSMTSSETGTNVSLATIDDASSCRSSGKVDAS